MSCFQREDDAMTLEPFYINGKRYVKEPEDNPLFVDCSSMMFCKKYSSYSLKDGDSNFDFTNSISVKGAVSKTVLSFIECADFNSRILDLTLNTTKNIKYLNEGWKARCFHLDVDHDLPASVSSWNIDAYIPEAVFDSFRFDYFQFGIEKLQLTFELDFFVEDCYVTEPFYFLTREEKYVKGFLREIRWELAENILRKSS